MNMRNVFDELDQRLEQVRHDILGTTGNLATRMPAVDLADHDTEYVLTAELPGVDKEHIRVDIGEDSIHIHATKETTQEKRKAGFLRQERSSSSYERVLGFPEQVSAEGARATFRNGVLEVVVPKTSPEKRKRRSIEIA